MERGCNIYDDYRGENANVMEGQISDQWSDGSGNNYYIIQTTGGGKYWDGYSKDAQNDKFNICVLNWAEDGYDYDNCEYQEFTNVKLQCENEGDLSQIVHKTLLSAAFIAMF